MDFATLRTSVCRANGALPDSRLVLLTWGNASGVDRTAGVMAIKPSGVAFEALTPADIVLVSLADGCPLDSGALRPSSDAPTHRALYLAFPEVGGVVHTHSRHATAWAQAGRAIPCQGTTHADVFAGPVPVTRMLTAEEIAEGYEAATGQVLIEAVLRAGLGPLALPGALVAGHGPFAWGRSPGEAVEHAVALEEIAAIGVLTRRLGGGGRRLPEALRRKHFERKQGPDAYYGQRAPAG